MSGHRRVVPQHVIANALLLDKLNQQGLLNFPDLVIIEASRKMWRGHEQLLRLRKHLNVGCSRRVKDRFFPEEHMVPLCAPRHQVLRTLEYKAPTQMREHNKIHGTKMLTRRLTIVER